MVDMVSIDSSSRRMIMIFAHVTISYLLTVFLNLVSLVLIDS